MMWKAILAVLVLAVAVEFGQARIGRNLQSTSGKYVIANQNDCFNFMAGQTTNVGSVCTKLVDGQVTITFATTGGWVMDQIHLWYNMLMSTMPQTNKGSPQIGKFPYQKTGPVTTWSHTFSLQSIGLSEPCVPSSELKALYIGAHAATSLKAADGITTLRSETAWSSGDLFVQQGMWGTFSTLMFQCIAPATPVTAEPEVTTTCETSFARYDSNAALAQCFLNIDVNGDGAGDFSRWGWSNGPFAPGTYTFNIYAGAGQCKYNTAGKLVGTATLDYNGSSATASFTTKGGFVMNESHLYIGTEILAQNNGAYTVAPGQYPWISTHPKATSFTYSVGGLSGNVYFVFHQVACGQF